MFRTPHRVPSSARLVKRVFHLSRTASGFQLVELLVTVFIISMFMAAITDALAKTYVQSTSSQNQVIAANVAQELIDSARDAGYTALSQPTIADGSWHNVSVYGTAAADQPSYLVRPLMIYGASSSAQNNRFRGSVRQMLTNIGNNQVQLQIEVSWPSEITGGSSRQLCASSLISQYGIHN